MAYLETTIGTDMNLDVDERAVIFAPFEGMARVAVFLMIAIWSSTV
jgi:hypothetical protein